MTICRLYRTVITGFLPLCDEKVIYAAWDTAAMGHAGDMYTPWFKSLYICIRVDISNANKSEMPRIDISFTVSEKVQLAVPEQLLQGR